MIDGQVRRRLPAGGAVPAVRSRRTRPAVRGPAYDARRTTLNGAHARPMGCTALTVHVPQVRLGYMQTKSPKTKTPNTRNAALIWSSPFIRYAGIVQESGFWDASREPKDASVLV